MLISSTFNCVSSFYKIIIDKFLQGTVLHVELTPSNNLQQLKRVVGGLVGAIHLRVDLRLSKVMVI